ncbi:MAG: hypothetical protein WCA35_14360 [Kovacikia sp.]
MNLNTEGTTIEITETLVTVDAQETVVELEIVQPEETIVLQVGLRGPPGTQGPPGSAAYRNVLTASTGQTVFNLLNTSTMPHLSQLYINGVKATYGTEYVINLTVLTWLGDLRLEPEDEIEINYI